MEILYYNSPLEEIMVTAYSIWLKIYTFDIKINVYGLWFSRAPLPSFLRPSQITKSTPPRPPQSRRTANFRVEARASTSSTLIESKSRSIVRLTDLSKLRDT